MFTQSAETEKNILIGEGIAVEYTRDSPLFRQQLAAVEQSYCGISSYLEGYVMQAADPCSVESCLLLFLIVLFIWIVL